ncbi:MAG: CGNR zinc finger domain-containing protein [Solirubrobacterales bacterium]|nr:CGNR zinc finger domain-containing protein [Solirubrobacterales bacterium]
MVQAFANTFWDLERHRPEKLRTPQALASWLEGRGLLNRGARLNEGDLRRATEVREGIRSLLFANNGSLPDHAALERLNLALQGACVCVRLNAGGWPQFFSPHNDLDGALGLIAANVALAQLEGGFARLKACPGPDCGWAFYDYSRNQTGTWCSMSICGSRIKARQYRRRQRGTHGA